ncbi:N-acetylglucosamine-1-phosphodiester alpha-N-acetylglucosaminidase isoform X2 [Ascaphus truei]|uniref:N-acetylglucosamine-1-phosphodiester alpha-N-acetylglucosaminidase isoform X2 n=1 Tax=Ascaphus truei TaxID=8439 RepID=UPI003F59210F
MAAPMRAAGCGVSEAHDGNPPLVREGAQSHPGSAGHRETLRLLLIFQCCLYVSARNSLLDDLLLPYPPLSKHGPNHSHRNVRDCQPIAHGNTTHEEWPSNNNTQLPVATTTVFVSKFLDANNEKTVYGHFTFVNNPLRTFSVLEPGGTGGCSKNLTATVEETVTYGKCIVAQNGGYFNTSTGTCLGNIVSNGMQVQNSRGIQNAQFGIRADGTMVFGYLSEEQVLDEKNPFVQLLSGVVWLLRNGEVYIEQSKAAECDRPQTTGTFDRFVNVISARTALGHDQEGRLILFHVDGQTDDRGLNLWEMANFLKGQGVINAINLDGGGSATLVINGTLSNYPSDHCVVEPKWRCPRSISTVLCVHEPFCDPPDCGGHGQCVVGECQCTDYWTGPACKVLYCGPSNCSGHGTCTQNGCACDAGWMGSVCDNACVQGFYGDGCTRECHCQNNGTCDHVDGTCGCLAGYKGLFCEQVCSLGFFGPQCQQICRCDQQCYCHHVTGSCNITHEHPVNYSIAKVGRCLESVMFTSWEKSFRFGTKDNFLTDYSNMSNPLLQEDMDSSMRRPCSAACGQRCIQRKAGTVVQRRQTGRREVFLPSAAGNERKHGCC